MTFEKIREAVLKLPEVEEGSAWGLSGFRVKKKLFVVFREDLGAVVLRATFDQRDAMIEEDPETFFTTDHHRPHPWVLAHVTKLRAPLLAGLLQMSWKYAMAEATKATKPRAKKR